MSDGSNGPGGTQPPTLRALNVRKTFGAFTALDDVSLELRPGSVHALLGENGAGKSTLVKCIMGYHRPDGGRILLDEREVTPRNPCEARALGLGMVYQHFTLVPNMSVTENLVLSRARLPLLIDWAAERAALARFVATMPFTVQLDATVRSLAAGEKQKLEILKQLYLQSRIVILDEPTSVLTPGEAEELLSLLRGMASAGRISVLMITHKFREVLGFADEVTVLRRGRMAGGGKVAELTPSLMAEMMMGSAAPLESVRAPATNVGESRLRVAKLAADDDIGVPALRGVSFDVRAGEIVGIAAVAGNGQEELVEVLAGQRSRSAGDVHVHGEPYFARREQLHEHKVRCLPEEPLRNACVPSMSVAENMAFRSFDRPPFARGGFALSHRAIRDSAAGLQRDYGIRAPSMSAPIGQLSGGNVQRAVLARELRGEVDVLIAANPCMGLDFAAVSEIHARIRKARDQGAAVLLVSADLDEVLALSDRVLVMSEGQVVHETTPETADVTAMGRFMAGHEA
jgi:general nucleoside transport system ATP-binding protein